MSKKEELKERWEKVKEDYSILDKFGDYPDDLFDKMEKWMIEKPKDFKYCLKILEGKEPRLWVPRYTTLNIHTGEDWDIEDNEFDEVD